MHKHSHTRKQINKVSPVSRSGSSGSLSFLLAGKLHICLQLDAATHDIHSVKVQLAEENTNLGQNTFLDAR